MAQHWCCIIVPQVAGSHSNMNVVLTDESRRRISQGVQQPKFDVVRPELLRRKLSIGEIVIMKFHSQWEISCCVEEPNPVHDESV